MQRQSKSEESALSRLQILADVLGNKRSWFVICDWWISIRFVCFCISRFVAFELLCSVAMLLTSAVSLSLALSFFYLLYTKTWQVYLLIRG